MREPFYHAGTGKRWRGETACDGKIFYLKHPVMALAPNQIEGNGYLLRPFKQADAESLARHANNAAIVRQLRDEFPHPYTLKEARMFIEHTSQKMHDIIFAVDIDGEACGGIGITGMKDVYRFNAEIGYWLSEVHWGKGIMTDAVGRMVELAFLYYQWTRLFAGVFSSNSASMRVLEKNGFTREAIHREAVKKEGEYLDELVYALLKKDWEKQRG